MTKRYYPAVIETDDEPGFSVFFPDFPGCVSAGDSLEDAIQGAKSALAGHIDLMVEDGDKIPDASSLDRIKLDEDIEVALVALIEANLPGRKQRYNVTLDSSLVDAIDRISNNRSGYLEQAAREKLHRETA